MIIVTTLLAPVAIYGLFLLLSAASWGRRVPPSFVAALACVWIFAGVTASMYYGAKWPRSTEIAWTGMHEPPESPAGRLVIGGSRQTDVIGWPSGSFEPRVAIQAARGATQAQLDVSRGGAFIVDPQSSRVINGRLLEAEHPVTIDGYQFTVDEAPLILRLFVSRHVRVTQGTRVVADFALNRRSFNRFFGLDYLNSRTDPEKVEKFAPYENWSRGVLVVATAEGTIKLLDPSYRSSIACKFPCTFDLRWRRISQRLVINYDTTGALSVHFDRPWRRTSPVPPRVSENAWQLIVTRHPEPGDYAFLLPLGGGVSDPRAILTLDDSDGQVRLRSGGANTNVSEIGRESVVTSSAGVRVGPTVQEFATSVDVLNAAAVTVALFFALVVLLAGILLTRPLLVEPRQQWLVYGICTAAWALLALRTGLAVRYAASPELLDRLAVSGIRLSLLAAAVIPGAILLSVFLRAEQHQARPLKTRQTSGNWATAYLIFLLAVAWFEMASPRLIFPKLPRVITPSMGGASAWLSIAGATAVIAYFLLSIRSVATARTPGDSPFPFPVYRLVAGRFGSDFWNGITSARRLRDLGPLTILALLLLVGLPFLLRVVGVAFSGTKVVQEVVTPLLFTLVPATIWLSASMHFHRRGRDWWWWVLAAIAACITVAVPLVITPVMISDPGSILATSSVFVPLALILLLCDRARPAGLIMAAIFVAGLAFVIYVCFNVETILPVGNKGGAGNVPSRLFVYVRGGSVPQAILAKSAALEDAYEHTWENRAIAHEAGWKGLGFGNTPNRRSRVGQQTLQADSVFSFFILGDHGVIGGLALLLVYLAPFLFFVWYTRRDTHLSTALGMIVAASFFLEAAAHAAMNIGLLPFAGRNLPLLASNSPTDAVKWACLLIVAAQTPFWSLSGTELLTTVSRTRPTIFSDRMQRWSPAILAVSLILVVGGVGFEASRVVSDARFGEPFTWDSILEEVQHLADTGELTVDKDTSVNLRNPAVIGERSLLVRELRAFNQLAIDEKLGEPPNGQLAARLWTVSTPDGFNRALRDESATQSDESHGRPPLFRLVALPRYADEAGEIPIVGETHKVVPNPLFNTRISFRTAPTKQLPFVEWSARQYGSFVLRGAGFNIEIPRRSPQPFENRIIDLEGAGDNAMQVRSDTNIASPRGEIWLRVPVRSAIRRKLFVRFDVENDALYLDDPPGGFHLRVGRHGSDIHVLPRERVKLASGDSVRLPVNIGLQPQFGVEERGAMPLIGPAWVDGTWRVATDSISPFPWTAYLESALEREWERLGPEAAAARYRSLTVHRDLQASAQTTVANVATELHAVRLQSFAAYARRVRVPTGRALKQLDAAMPPRVALSILRLPAGEVLAMAGAPRMTAGDIGVPCDGGGFCPSHRWIDELAPSFIRVRYGGDRNFDTIEMGSSTKPLFAAAAIAVHPDLDRHLHVQGPDELETSVFGIPITKTTGWLAHFSPRWTDFRRYLAYSDNRYQVRLGFIALADRDAQGMMVDGQSPADRESMDGVSEWHRYPRFPSRMQFSPTQPTTMTRIDDSPFAQTMRAMYSVGITQGDFLTRRYSLWTANEIDDLPADRRPAPPADAPGQQPSAPQEAPISHAFDSISPQIASLGFDYIRDPRQYVSLLLGGNENRWANVDFAAAFATAVTGHPVVPHILPKMMPVPRPGRRTFPSVAQRLHSGLEAVITEGTAAFARDGLIPPQLRAIQGLKVYAKSGTLAVDEGHATTSRLVIAFIIWENEPNGIARKGVVLSMVGEHAHIGDATRWLARYITENADAIAHELQ